MMPPRGNSYSRGDAQNVRRPRSSPGFQQSSHRSKRFPSVLAAVNLEDEAIAEEEEEEKIELLEYEWPDLPPLPSMKDAVSRCRVSQGISYLLPVDKGRNSINNRFRTDLRAMFQEPYASDDLQYDDNRVKLSAKVHFLSNTADTKWTRQHLSSIPVQLNADCEGARKLYVHSAPTAGVASRRMGIDPNKLRKRSNLFLPVKASKAQVSPEIVKLREEASRIIKEGLTYQEEDEDQPDRQEDKKKDKTRKPSNPFLPTNGGHRSAPADSRLTTLTAPENGKSLLTTFGGSHLSDSMGTSTLQAKLKNAHTHHEKFSNYEDFKKSLPAHPTIPTEFQSSFLSQDDNQRVWNWLHYGETLSDFDYFLSICG